jgi:hypothetical protein
MDPRAWTARTTRQGAPVDLILVGLEARKKVLG